VRDYPQIFSLSQLLTTAGIAGGPAFVGAITAASGYGPAMVAIAVASAAGGAVLAAGKTAQPALA